EHERHLYWEHPDGQKSIRIVYSKQDGNVTGFNLMGVRYRHEVCERWIKTKTPIWEVLPELHLANFDPEFFDTYENQLIQTYYEVDENAVQLESKPKRKKILNIFSF
ncbi:MAG: NAD(P)/FAD-dependent oxidoreductase, partial [Candidatus Cyclobacteriaceae bacterium M3_2C_046]